MKKLRILYVEDESLTRLVMTKILSENFGEVYEASDGLEGLELFSEVKPDIVVTDLTMPRLNGRDMVKHILWQNPDQKVIIISGYIDEKESYDNCVLMRKPVVAADIIRKIKEMTSGRQ
jgi:YesN/AraC family two-component response regulator